MGERSQVKKKLKPLWKVQGRFCIRCGKTFLPRAKDNAHCEDCAVLILLGMGNIGQSDVASGGGK